MRTIPQWIVGLSLGILPLAPGSLPRSITRSKHLRTSPLPPGNSEPGALERYRSDVHVDVSAYYVDDRQLLATLLEIGRPVGLVRSGGRVTLTKPVTDAELSPSSAADPAAAQPEQS